jgi:PKD repeat protein
VSAYAYHEYNSAGSFTVRLTVTGPGGSHTKTVPNYITVSEPPPLADFIANPNMGLKPLTVSFASTSTGAITSYLWDFGDGTGANVANPVHIYNNAGVYTVRLTVNGPGGSDTSTQFGCIGVDEPPPVAGIAASPTSGVQPLTVTFTSTSTGAISDYYWDFGDGTYSTAPNVSHIYGYAGTYTAGLWVSGPGGSDSAAMTITVNVPPPVATFTASPRAGDEPLAVSFSNTSTGAITSCYWTFGDGTHGTAWSPSHTYRSVGVFDVTLTVTGPGGSASRVKNDFITVTYAPPVAQFSATPRSGAAPLAVSFTDTSTGEITAWSWNFGDGRTSVARNPVRTFSNPGTYTIKLTVTGPGGSNTRTKAGYITVR